LKKRYENWKKEKIMSELRDRLKKIKEEEEKNKQYNQQPDELTNYEKFAKSVRQAVGTEKDPEEEKKETFFQKIKKTVTGK
jgi:hypothetical protein